MPFINALYKYEVMIWKKAKYYKRKKG